MNICIIGTARSGTTAIYTLLQKILLKNVSAVEYHYEPFLWSRDSFNEMYDKVRHKFDTLQSISFEGIHAHLSLPLFIDQPDEFAHNPYLQSIFIKDEKTKLSKFIRANGRVKLFHKLDPGCRFVFIIRNPLDVVNSLNHKFSFFGGEFYTDDFQRLREEANRIFQAGIPGSESLTYLEKQLLWWKYMNRHALASFSNYQGKALKICQEELESHPEVVVRSLCDFLEMEYTASFLADAAERKSEVTKQFIISSKELDVIDPFLDEYMQLLAKNDIPHSFNAKNIIKKYNLSNTEIINQHPQYGKSPLYLMNQILASSKARAHIRMENEKLSKTVDGLQKENEKLAIVNDLLSRQIKDLHETREELSGLKRSWLFKIAGFFRIPKK